MLYYLLSILASFLDPNYFVTFVSVANSLKRTKSSATICVLTLKPTFSFGLARLTSYFGPGNYFLANSRWL
jgi:hypothetical protein